MVEHIVVALLKERDICPLGGDGMWGDEARVGEIHYTTKIINYFNTTKIIIYYTKLSKMIQEIVINNL